MALKKAANHWDFLDEIEAPMWTDLTVESKSANQDIDDEWFHISHLFHQCSSRQLKSVFSHSDGVGGTLDFDLQGPSSPKLPSSVSRSRGKHYKNRKWGSYNQSFLSNKHHLVEGLDAKTSQEDSGCDQDVKFNSRPVNSGVSSSKTSTDCESRSSEIDVRNSFRVISITEDSSRSSSLAIKEGGRKPASTVTSESNQQQQQKDSGSGQGLKPKSSSANSVVSTSNSSLVNESNLASTTVTEDSSSISSLAIKAGERNSTATVTSESCQQHPQKPLKVSNQSIGRTSVLLSVMRMSLRQSRGTRKASRVEINDIDGKHINGRKSSSSKSSVGSSSNPGHDDNKNTKLRGRLKTDRAPDNRNVVRVSQAAKNKDKIHVSKASNAQNANRTTCYSKGGKAIAAESAHKEAVKSKVSYQRAHKKALEPHRVDEQGSFTAAKKSTDKFRGTSRFPGVGKENALGKEAVGLEFSGRSAAVEGRNRGQRTKECTAMQSEKQNGARTRLIGLKGKVSGQVEGKSSTKVIHKFHFR